MEAKELRIGNFIDRNGLLIKVSRNTIFDLDELPHILGEIYQPITLTEEWLIKFGFKKVKDNFITVESYHYENKNCWIYLIDAGFELELNTLSERNNLCRTYLYVHQLQNLYFALTGEELTLK